MVDRICDNCMNRVPADAEKCPKCGIRFENTNPGGALPNGWVLGERYTIGRYIDIDGEGVTYSAIDGNSFQRVTIKEYMPVTLCASRDEYGAIVSKPACEVLFKTTRMDFVELYQTLETLGRTEGLVSVLDVVQENNTAYAVMEKIEGPTLAEYLIRQAAPIETGRALTILRPVMLGVEALHSAGVVHRGISPDNIILESGGTAKLCGYATLALRQQGSELKPKLYPGYSAPEQYAASEFEGRYTDIYALGGVLYRMVTGETPIPANERRMQDILRPARTANKEVPAFLSTAITRAMRLPAAERIQNINDFRLALSGESPRVAGAAPRPPVQAPVQQPDDDSADDNKGGLFGLTRQQTMVAAVVLGILVVLLVVIIIVTTLGKGNDDSSVPSSVSISAASELVQLPNFVGMDYETVINNESYKSKYTFGEPLQQYDETAPEGRIIAQNPVAGADWDGKTPIQFTVSIGSQPVKIPDFFAQEVTLEEAEKYLNDLGVTTTAIKRTNDGTYTPGQVIETDPKAGEEVVPGERTVQIFYADEAPKVAMPDVTNDTPEKASNVLVGIGISRDRIVTSNQRAANDGQYIAGTIESTDPAKGTQISAGSVTVTLKLYDTYYMPDLTVYVGSHQDNITNWLNQRSANFTYEIVTVTNDGSHTAGVVAGIDAPAKDSVVNPGTKIVIRVYDTPAPPADPPPAAE